MIKLSFHFSWQWIMIVLFSLAISCNKKDKALISIPTSNEIRGVDISFLPQIRAANCMVTNFNGVQEDMLPILIREGVNTFRLRVWVNPPNGHSGFEEVKMLAQEIKNNGGKVWLSLHYSDSWADPSQQTKPASWTGINFLQLQDSVYAYTKKVVTTIQPDIIQIGNEVNFGFLWPEGSINQLAQMRILLNKGIDAVRKNSNSTKIMIHYAGNDQSVAFFDSLKNLDFDLIGISYYPIWHGSLSKLQNQLLLLNSTFNKEVVIAETSYPFSFGWNDWTNNVIGLSNQILPEFSASPEGQKAFVLKIRNMIGQLDHGRGFCYWGGEWISYKGDSAKDGSSWENQALWGFQKTPLPVMKAFNN